MVVLENVSQTSRSLYQCHGKVIVFYEFLREISAHMGSLHSQVEHQVRDKFNSPILYGLDNSKFYDIFPTYT